MKVESKQKYGEIFQHVETEQNTYKQQMQRENQESKRFLKTSDNEDTSSQNDISD